MILYYYPACGFSQVVLGTIKNLKVEDQIELRDIRANQKYAQELTDMCGNTQVPTLVIDGKPMRESAIISQFLVEKFM